MAPTKLQRGTLQRRRRASNNHQDSLRKVLLIVGCLTLIFNLMTNSKHLMPFLADFEGFRLMTSNETKYEVAATMASEKRNEHTRMPLLFLVFLLGGMALSLTVVFCCLSLKTRGAITRGITESAQSFLWQGSQTEPWTRSFAVWRETYFGSDCQVHIVPAACTILAAMIMHIPGLACRIAYRETSMDVLGAFLGSVTEGVFLLLLYTKAYLVAQQLTANMRQKHHASQALPLLEGALLLALVSTTVLLVSFSVASSIGDYTFQSITGGLIPDMWALAAGYKESRAQIDEFKKDGINSLKKILMVVACFLGSFLVHGFGQYYWKTQCCRKKGSTYRVSGYLLLTAMLVALLIYQFGFWQPVMHSTLSLFGSYIFTPDKSEAIAVQKLVNMNIDPAAHHQGRKRPNVIYIIHESLSGAYWLNRKEAERATPFFQSLRQKDEMFVFPHARSVSGDTTDAMTALVTGCLPISNEARTMAYGRSIATEFKQQGYDTASFSARQSDMTGGKWFMLTNYLTGNMDFQADPVSENIPFINAAAADDRHFAKLFSKWSTNRTLAGNNNDTSGADNNRTAINPFFTLFYSFNAHFPYVKLGTGAKGLNRYYESFQTIDEAIQIMFDHLNATGELENTIVIGSGDHGEALEGRIGRLRTWNPYVLHPLIYMYVPKQFMTDEERTTLRSNEEKVVSTLDLFQTAQHFVYGGNAQATADIRNMVNAADARNEFESKNCITGFDLLDVSIPMDRVAMSWNSVSHPSPEKGMMSAISSMDRGLFVHGRKNDISLKEMTFGNCTSSKEKTQCVREASDTDLTYWREVITRLVDNKSLMTNTAGRTAYFMEALLKKMEIPSFASPTR